MKGLGDLPEVMPLCPRGSTDNPEMYTISIDRYFSYRGSLPFIPFIRWGTLPDTADARCESYVTGNPYIMSLWSGRLTNVVAPDSESILGRREFRVGGKRAKGPHPVAKFPNRDASSKVVAIARRALQLWFLLDRPETADKEDLLLFIDDCDAKFYGRRGRRFAQELLSTQSFYHDIRAGRGYNRVRSKKGTIEDASPAHEFDRLYKILEHTA